MTCGGWSYELLIPGAIGGRDRLASSVAEIGQWPLYYLRHIVYWRQPPLCRFRISRSPLHPTGDRSLGNLKSEHKQLATNARRSPGWVVIDHPED
jgi:hypothetical protein